MSTRMYIDSNYMILECYTYKKDAIKQALQQVGAKNVTIESRYRWPMLDPLVVFDAPKDNETLNEYMEYIAKTCQYPKNALLALNKDWE